MSNRTLIPALRASVGDWVYYICVMKYAQVAREVSFAHELEGHAELSKLIQRGLTKRTEQIVKYLRHNDHRFLGALIVAAWGGDPQYKPVVMQDNDGLLADLDEGFGVLIFDGSQQYFALDGQHRLRAIKDVLKTQPELGSEEICVLLVSHMNTTEGRQRTRRLFTNINRNAKSTSTAENIALDEDDAFAILARRFVTDHDFLSQEGRVEVLKNSGDNGELTLAGASIAKSNARAFTTLQTLYEILKNLTWGLHPSIRQLQQRPSDSDLDDAYSELAIRLDLLMKACGDVRSRLEQAVHARDVRAPKGDEGAGHAFLRPVVQREVSKICSLLAGEGSLAFEDVLARLSKLDWHLASAPWTSIVTMSGSNAKMVVNNQTRDLLQQLLRVHLYPESRANIQRARRAFNELRGMQYPVSEQTLMASLES